MKVNIPPPKRQLNEVGFQDPNADYINATNLPDLDTVKMRNRDRVSRRKQATL